MRLLQRTTRAVSLTDPGARFLERARRILADLEEAERLAESDQARPSGRLGIAAPVMFGRLHVAPLVGDYLARYPEVVAELQLNDRWVGPRRGGARRGGAHRAAGGFEPGGAPGRRDAAGGRGLGRLSRRGTGCRRRRRTSPGTG